MVQCDRSAACEGYQKRNGAALHKECCPNFVSKLTSKQSRGRREADPVTRGALLAATAVAAGLAAVVAAKTASQTFPKARPVAAVAARITGYCNFPAPRDAYIFRYTI